jgi:hypothetical protein
MIWATDVFTLALRPTYRFGSQSAMTLKGSVNGYSTLSDSRRALLGLRLSIHALNRRVHWGRSPLVLTVTIPWR